jgi:Ca2+-binding EF-hand superfamily protein
MLVELDITRLKEAETKDKFLTALTVEGTKGDYALLQACLNVYRPPERNTQNSQDAIQSMLLSAFKQNVTKVIEYLDIDKSGTVSKAEFIHGSKKIAKGYDDVEFETLFTIYAEKANAREVTNAQLKTHLENFLKRVMESKKTAQANGRSLKDNFELVREKIKRFFNMDTSVFYQDLTTFDMDGKGKVTFSDLTYYLAYTSISLTDEDKKTLGLTFRAVGSTLLSIDYVTSMIFFGKANSHTLCEVDRTLIQKMFFSQIREEMNLYKLSSFDIYQDFLGMISHAGDGKITISKVDLQAVVNKKQLGFSTEETSELFQLIAQGGKDGFDYRMFRNAIYGRELEDVTWMIFKLDERLRSKQIDLHQFFFKTGQQEILFKDFADSVLVLDPLLKYDDIDLLFCRLDKSANNKVDLKELEQLFIEYSVFCDFKQYLIAYAQKNGKDLVDILSMTDNYDSLLKEDFKKLVREITEGKFSEDDIGRMFRLLDKDQDGAVSKIEMKEILDLAQKQLYNAREYLTFRNGVIEYCEKEKLSLRQVFERFSDRKSSKITKVEIKKMAEATISYSGVKLSVIQAVLDANMSDTIDLKEFKEGILGPNVDVEQLMITIRRILAKRNEDFHVLFKRFDTDNNDSLDHFEFKNFLKLLGLRLNFVESEKLFDVLAMNDRDQITKKDFFGTFVAVSKDDVMSKNIATIIQAYKAKVKKDKPVQHDTRVRSQSNDLCHSWKTEKGSFSGVL